MWLTEAGSAFLDGARRTLAEADRAVDSARRAAAGELGQLRLAFSWSARFETLPALGRAFHARHPHVQLLSQEMWNAQMIPALQAGTIDAAVSLCPEVASGIESELVRTEEVIAVSLRAKRCRPRTPYRSPLLPINLPALPPVSSPLTLLGGPRRS